VTANGSAANILLVDDQVENLIALEAVLEPLGQNLVRAQSGEEALGHLLRDEYALILLDVQMPNLDGFQTATFIKEREKTRHIPIIFLTALSKEMHHIFRGYSAGAVDYVVKPFDPMVLRSKVQVFVDLHTKERALRESEERFRTAFENAPIGVALASPEGEIVEANRGLAAMLGMREAEIAGRHLVDLLHPDDAAKLDLDGHGEVRFVRADGVPVWAEVNASMVRDGGGRPYHVIVQVEDVTARKEAERDRAARAKERAARAEAEAVAETMGKLQSVTDVALRHLTLEDLLREVLVRIRETIEVDACGILLIGGADRRGKEAVASGAAITPEGRTEVGVRIPVARDVSRRIAGAGSVVAIEEVHDPLIVHPLLKDSGIVSLAAAPLAVEGRLHGVLQIASTTKRRFTNQDKGLLQLIADRAALAIEHARLYEREHGIVETLQRALLPTRLPQLPGLQVAARYLPGGMGADVGGDWYDVFPLSDGRIGVAIGDVAGHGLRAAALMGQLRNSLRAYAIEGHGPAAVVDRLNRLVRDLEQGWMATLLYMVLAPDESEICFANAGHMPALALEMGDARFIEVDRGPPLGVGQDGQYVEVVEKVQPGSTLIVYTDGLVEEPGVSLDVSLAAMASHALAGPDDPDALCDHLVRHQVGEGQPRDDVAFVAVHTIPLSGERLNLRLPAEPKALPSVRRALTRWLEQAGAAEDEAYSVQLACHEACTNAIEHGYRFGEASFEVCCELREGQLTVTVADSGGWRGAGDSDRGRGFALMEGLMDTVEVTPGREGTTVVMTRLIKGAARVDAGVTL
jgi:PAS domain S-box-containing protein